MLANAFNVPRELTPKFGAILQSKFFISLIKKRRRFLF